MTHQVGQRTARHPKPVRMVACVAFAWLIAMVGAAAASGYTVLGAYFYPDHGSAGSRISVGELPLAVDCPTVRVWLAPGIEPSPQIESTDDLRLIRLRGTTRHTFDTVGTGLGSTFVFRVPPIAAGTYSTYWQCSGGATSWTAFDVGHTTFTLEPGVPGTDTVSPVPVSDPPNSIPWLGIMAGLWVLAGTTWLHRVRTTDR